MKDVVQFTLNQTLVDLVVYQIGAIQALLQLCDSEGSAIVKTGACKSLGDVINSFPLSPQVAQLRNLDCMIAEDCRELIISRPNAVGESIDPTSTDTFYPIGTLTVISHFSRLARRSLDVLFGILRSSTKLPVLVVIYYPCFCQC